MRKFRKSVAIALSAMALAITNQARADVGCAFTITALAMTGDSGVNVSLTNNGNYFWWYVCSMTGSITVNTGYGTPAITSESCKALWSQLLTARASGRQITLWFHGPNDCNPASLPPTGTWMNPYPSNFVF
jgi:hypothetical protein